MSQTSQVSRVRPAVLAFAGAAAAYGVYLAFATFSPSQSEKSGLRRSNAIRRRSHQFTIKSEPPDDSAPLGWVVVAKGDRRLATNVSKDGAPTTNQVEALFPDVPASLYLKPILDAEAVMSILHACFLGRRDEQRQAILRGCGVDGIAQAMEWRNAARVISLATPLLDQILDTDHNTIQSAALRYLSMTGMTSLPPLETNNVTAEVDVAETEASSGEDDAQAEPEQGLKGLLYHIAETDAKRKAYEHRGINCEECGERPIRGVRWHCLNCPDFDLCSTCEANTTHHKTHVFVKIKIPLPVLSQPTRVYPLWYPGETYKIFKGLPADERASLRKTHDLDDAQMDAYFDQFTSFANVRKKADPSHIHAAIDRRAFNKALTCERWPNRFRPNVLYDRMFAFYDTNGDSLIDFDEFLSGIQYLRGPKRLASLKRALEGFDIDADGYVNRRDFLRLLQAKFEIQKVMVHDMVEGQERDQSYAAMDILRSSQPISSIFRWEEIPQGEERVPVGKSRDAFGDMQLQHGTKTILADDDAWHTEQTRRQHRLPGETHEQLRHHLSRFEELLGSPIDGPGSQSEDEQRLLDGGAWNGVNDYARQDDDDPPLNQDVIWQITLEGFNEILDRMFKAREEEDQRAVNARPEIERWKKEVDEAMQQKEELKRALQREIEVSGAADPLMETAMNSLNGTLRVKGKPETDYTPAAFESEIVPTDHDTLTKREEQIAQKPLEELLRETGYSAVDDKDGATTENGPRDVPSATSRQRRSESPAADPTMPQHRPNSSSLGTTSGNGMSGGTQTSSNDDDATVRSSADSAHRPPSREHLERLGAFAEQDREIVARGGLGRLSFAEVEAMVKSDKTRELKGLVTDWLEWASF